MLRSSAHVSFTIQALADAIVFPKLLDAYMYNDSSEDLRNKAKRALKCVLQKCVQLPALEPVSWHAKSFFRY